MARAYVSSSARGPGRGLASPAVSEPNAVTLHDLVEIEAVKRLKYRYLRCLDQKLWDDLEGCFTEGATASYGGGAYELDGRDAIMEFLRTSMGSETMLTSHRCHHPEIDLDGTGSATGTWALDDVVILTDLGLTIRGSAFYEDRYENVDGRWLIAHTGYKRTYEEIFPRSSVDGLRLTADWWATGGRSNLSG